METSSKLAVIVLAAGRGTRMRSDRPKILHELCGRPMLGHVLATANGHAVSSDGSEVKPSAMRRSNQLKLQESRPKFLTVEVLSSQKSATVTVDGTTVRKE